MTRLLLVVSLTLSPVACLPRSQPNGEPLPADGDFSKLPRLIGTISRADEVALYEGLPHQTFEKGLLESEQLRKPTVAFAGYPFYADPLPLAREDGARLAAAAADPKSYAAFAGEKLCGGFHPDYAVQFRWGNETSHVLVCFGCQEAKLLSRNRVVRVSLTTDGMQAFSALLKRYRQNRPDKQLPGLKPADLSPAR